MRAAVSWIRAVVPDLPDDVTTQQLADRLTALGLKLEAIERPGHDIAGPLVVGRVLSFEDYGQPLLDVLGLKSHGSLPGRGHNPNWDDLCPGTAGA